MMRIALEQLIHVEMDNVRVEQMIYVCHLYIAELTIMEPARGVHMGNALIHNHSS